MTVGALVKARLTGYSGTSAIVGTRVYPLRLPQNPTYEAITYQRISNGPQNGSTEIRESRWQINCWAQTYAEAHTLAGQVKAAFENWTDDNIKMAYVANEIDDDNDEVKVYRTIVDVMLVTTGD